MTGAASREALAALREQLAPALAGQSADALAALAEELYSISGLLGEQPQLRRALGDPATAPDARGGLLSTLLQSRVSAPALQIGHAAVRQRWSSPWDLADGLERCADDALLASAEGQGALDEVEDELFRFERIIDQQGEVAAILDEVTVPAERRIGLLDRLVAGKVAPVTLALLQHAVRSQRRRSITFAIDDLLAEAAARQARSLARVVSAVELTPAQHARLVAVLSQLYGRAMTVRTAVDPAVKGGLIIRVGDEVIDGSVAGRLAGARAALGG